MKDMTLTRRRLLAGMAAGAAMPALPRTLGATAAAMPVLRTEELSARLLPPEYPETRLWSYAGRSPGPELRLAQGARLRRRLENRLPAATTVHWHGIRIDNAMDGVPGLTQDAVPPGASFDYDFALPDAGTYWYHAHEKSYEQVARGLYGPLIVEEPDPPEVDREEVLVLDDWRVDPATGQLAANFEMPHDRSHAGRIGNYITTNGAQTLELAARRHERLRLRLVNASNARIFRLGLMGLEGWLMALDGMPLETPAPLTATLTLAPAQRADLIIDVIAEPGGEAFLVRQERDGGYAQAVFAVAGQAGAARRDAPGALPPNPVTALKAPGTARRLMLHMEGGAMGGMQGAMLNGRAADMREIAGANQFWAFNGMVGMPDAPLAELDRGEEVRVAIRNDTAFPHAMHVHGHHFREIGADGARGPWRDTLLVDRGETREIGFVADNPGDWLFHCHMLAHAASGMMTWFRVTG